MMRTTPHSSRATLLCATFACSMGVAVALPSAALADLRLCNMSQSRVGVSLGYRDGQGWVTEGWWNVKGGACETLLRGELAARYFYIHAVDYDRGGDWGGKSLMCTRDKEFTIRGVENCLSRGFDLTGYFEVDTGEQKGWTIQLLDQNRPAAGSTGGGMPAARP